MGIKAAGQSAYHEDTHPTIASIAAEIVSDAKRVAGEARRATQHQGYRRAQEKRQLDEARKRGQEASRVTRHRKAA